MIQIPLLRHGEPYYSLDRARVPHHRTHEPFAEISQANAGLIRRDLLKQQQSRHLLADIPTAELINICREAADLFLNAELPLGSETQWAADYVQQVSATTGLPHTLARRNMQKIRSMLAEMEKVVNGLTRNPSHSVLDEGFAEVAGQSLSFFPR